MVAKLKPDVCVAEMGMAGLPGTVLVLAGLILAARMDGFSRFGSGTVAVRVGLTLLAYIFLIQECSAVIVPPGEEFWSGDS